MSMRLYNLLVFLCIFTLGATLMCRSTLQRPRIRYQKLPVINRHCAKNIHNCAIIQILINNRTITFPQCEGEVIRGAFGRLSAKCENNTECVERTDRYRWSRTCCCNTNLCNTDDFISRSGNDTTYLLIFCVTCVAIAIALRLACCISSHCRSEEIPHRKISF
uniref:Uncharacterized protein n=1 Tax=Parascaris univalens TaxID=6257 RepID=A0A914ZLI2_PARUN